MNNVTVSNTYDNTICIGTGATVGEFTNTGAPIYVTVPQGYDWNSNKAPSDAGYFVYNNPNGNGISNYSSSGGTQTIGIYQRGLNYTNADNTLLLVNSLIGGDISNVNVYGGSNDGKSAFEVANMLCTNQNFKSHGGHVNSVTMASCSNDNQIVDIDSKLQNLLSDDVSLYFVTNKSASDGESRTAKKYASMGGDVLGLSFETSHDGKCEKTIGFNYGDYVSGKGPLNTSNSLLIGYYTIDKNGNKELHKGFDDFPSITSTSTGTTIKDTDIANIDIVAVSSFGNAFMQSNYGRTLEYIEALNQTGSNLNISDCVYQIYPSLSTGVLVDSTNDAIINYEIGNANMIGKLSNGLDAILSTTNSLKALDEALANDANNPGLDVGKYTINVAYKDYDYKGTYENVIDTSKMDAADVSLTDTNSIRQAFNLMVSEDNQYISSMINMINEFKSGGNEGAYWDSIKNVLDGYSNVLNEKMNLNTEVNTNIQNALNKIDSIINELGHNPATQGEVEAMEAEYTQLLATIETLKANLWEVKTVCDSWGKNPHCEQITVKNEAVAAQLEAAEAQAAQLKADIEAYKQALEDIREQEKLINEEFYKIQKFDGYLKSILPDYNCLELNQTGWDNIHNGRNALNASLLGSGGGGSVGSEGGIGIEGTFTETQRKIIEASMQTPTTGSGYCAAWVEKVYRQAGEPIAGNANDLYRRYCDTPISEIKPGMIIAVDGTAGNPYGHCGIYIGNGQVRSNNSGKVQTMALDDWVNRYGHDAKCGYSPKTKAAISSESPAIVSTTSNGAAVSIGKGGFSSPKPLGTVTTTNTQTPLTTNNNGSTQVVNTGSNGYTGTGNSGYSGNGSYSGSGSYSESGSYSGSGYSGGGYSGGGTSSVNTTSNINSKQEETLKKQQEELKLQEEELKRREEEIKRQEELNIQQKITKETNSESNNQKQVINKTYNYYNNDGGSSTKKASTKTSTLENKVEDPLVCPPGYELAEQVEEPIVEPIEEPIIEPIVEPDVIEPIIEPEPEIIEDIAPQTNVDVKDNSALKTVGIIAGAGLAVGAAALGAYEYKKSKDGDEDSYEDSDIYE